MLSTIRSQATASRGASPSPSMHCLNALSNWSAERLCLSFVVAIAIHAFPEFSSRMQLLVIAKQILSQSGSGALDTSSANAENATNAARQTSYNFFITAPFIQSARP